MLRHRSALALVICGLLFLVGCREADPTGPIAEVDKWSSYGTVRERWYTVVEDDANPWVRPPQATVWENHLISGTTDGRLEARDRLTGEVRWSFKLSYLGVGGRRLFTRGRILIANTDLETFAVDAGTGRTLWRYLAPPGPEAESDESVGFVGIAYLDADAEAVYVPAWGGTLSAVDLWTGAPRWVWQLDPSLRGRSGVEGARVAGDTVYATGWYWPERGCQYGEAWLLALDRSTGRELWRRTLGEWPCTTGPWVQPSVSGDFVVTSTGKAAVAIDRFTLREVWRFSGESEWIGHFGPTVRDGVAYVDGEDDRTYALDVATGRQLWAARTWGQAEDMVVSDSRVYVTNGVHLNILDRATGRFVARIRHPHPHSALNSGNFSSIPVIAAGRAFVTVTNSILTPEHDRYERAMYSFDEP